MEWEDKIKMVRAHNTDDFKLFKEIVLQHLDSFDNQAWDMFFTCIALVKETIIADLDFYKKINQVFHSKKDSIEMGFRSKMRWVMMDVIIEESEVKP